MCITLSYNLNIIQFKAYVYVCALLLFYDIALIEW